MRPGSVHAAPGAGEPAAAGARQPARATLRPSRPATGDRPRDRSEPPYDRTLRPARASSPRIAQRWHDERTYSPAGPAAEDERVLRADDVPLPVGRPAHGARRDLLDPRRARPSPAHDGPHGPQPDRVGRVRSAGRERRPQPRRRPEGVDLRQHRRAALDHRPARVLVRLGPGAAHLRPRVLPLDPVAVPRSCSTPASPTAARPSSTGTRSTRPCSPTSRSSTAAASARGAVVERVPADPVVLPHHRLRRRAARRASTRIDWPDRVKNAQRNWIGRSEGAEVTFGRPSRRATTRWSVYTTRPDTLFGATYFVFAPEHPLVGRRMADDADYRAFIDEVSRRSDVERGRVR